MDRTEIEMYIATARELIAVYKVDVIPYAEGDKLFEAQGIVATCVEKKKILEDELDKYLTHEEAIHFFRKVILDFRVRRYSGFYDDEGYLIFTTDSKFEVERCQKAIRTLDGYMTLEEESEGEMAFLIELPKEAIKEIQSVKKPRKRRKSRK